MESDNEVGSWEAELESLLLRVDERFGRVEPRWRMRDYVRGLLGPVGRKNSWQIAERVGNDTLYGLQRLLSWCRQDPDQLGGLRDGAARAAGRCPDRGRHRLPQERHRFRRGAEAVFRHRRPHGELPVFAAYTSAKGRALVDRELYLPKSWTEDADRCRAARIPEGKSFAFKPKLARAMVRRALNSALPIAWVTADAAYRRGWHFRRMLEETGVGYVRCPSHSRSSHP
nr:transposase [Streptomyces dioscori]